MMKKLVFLVTLTVLLSIGGLASAADVYRAGPGQISEPPGVWDWDAEVSSAWNNGDNWVTWDGSGAVQPVLPTSADSVFLNRGLAYPVLIDSSTSAAASILNVGYWDSLDAKLDVTGGTLAVGDRLSIGTAGSDVHGYMNVLGGAITVGGPLVVGGQDPYDTGEWGAGNGSLAMSGGTMNVTGNLQLGYYAGTGDMDLSGGTIIAATLEMTANGSLTVTDEGMLVLPGNQLALVNGYIGSGWISGAAEFLTSGPYAGNTAVLVPEPTTLVLLGVGGLALLRRKR
jgi:hypothetical protein